MSSPSDLRTIATTCVELARQYAATQDQVGFKPTEISLMSNAISYALEGRTSDARITGHKKLPLMQRLIIRAVVEKVENVNQDESSQQRIALLRGRAGATMNVTLPIEERR